MTRRDEHGPLVLLVGRDRRELDVGVSRILADHFRRRGCVVAWDDPSWAAMDELARIIPGLERWSESRRLSLRKWLRRLWCLLHWRDLRLLLGAPRASRIDREDILRRRVSGVGQGNGVLLVGRSAGGMVSTRLAEELGAVGVIALGYPFRAPDSEPDPMRTRHLKTLRVPTLILQGVHDPYGGSESASGYPLSDKVALRFLQTDHNFAVDSPCWGAALGEIDRFLDALPVPRPSAAGFTARSMHLSYSRPTAGTRAPA